MNITELNSKVMEEVSSQISDTHAMMRGLTEAECRADQRIVAAREDLQETMRTFIAAWIAVENKLSGSSEENAANPRREEQNALRVAHMLFDSFCEQIWLAESFEESPEDWVVPGGPYETTDAVIAAGEDLAAYCQKLVVIAKQLWVISSVGVEQAI